MISSYPEKGLTHGQKTVGGAAYTKKTLLALKKRWGDLKITVLAERFDGAEEYEEEGIKVKRVWRRGSAGDILKLYRLCRREGAGRILVGFEAFMFGGAGQVGLFLVVLAGLKLAGKKIYLVLHQVPADFEELGQGGWRAVVMKGLTRLFYGLVLAVSERVVVFEERFKKVLGGGERIKVIPHAVAAEKRVGLAEAKRGLGLSPEVFYVLFFGFVSPYKGADWLAEFWQRPPVGMGLILAGGGNPNHMGEAEYAGFVQKTLARAKAAGGETPGFVPEEKISLYFAAAEVVVLPYRALISSSGPLALAFGYGRPVLLSRPLAGYFESEPLQAGLKAAGLKEEELIFDLERKSFEERLDWARREENLKKMTVFAEEMGRRLSWEKIGEEYEWLLKGER